MTKHQLLPSKTLGGMNRITLWFLLLSILHQLLTYSVWVRNYRNANQVLEYVSKCSSYFDTTVIEGSESFQAATAELRRRTAPYMAFTMLNKYALDITLNWLCNLADMKGAYDNLVLFTLDTESTTKLREAFPSVKTVQLSVKCLTETFSPGGGTYQAMFNLRSNIIRSILHQNLSVWSIQQDTAWSRNLFDQRLEEQFSDADVLLDQQAYWATKRKRESNGANFFVRNSIKGVEFMHDVAWWQRNFFVHDIAVFQMHCYFSHDAYYKCEYIPHKVHQPPVKMHIMWLAQGPQVDFRYISGWEWIFTTQKHPPMLIQLDGERGMDNKILAMKDFRMWFLDDDGRCNRSSVEEGIDLITHSSVPKKMSSNKLYEKASLAFGHQLNTGYYMHKYSGIFAEYTRIP